MHDDLQMMRQLEMEKCFADRQIPCRWVQDMGYGFGFPLFNFYPPLPYLIGQGIRFLGFSFVDTVKITFALSFIVSGVSMYLLAKEFFPENFNFKGRKISLGALVSAIFYIWAPYHAVDVYVRGAMNEAWALSFSPLIFWSVYRLIICNKRETRRWIILLALAYSALLTSHNLMVLIFTPVLAGWVLIHLWRKSRWSRLPKIIISGIWALGLAAFFTLPALAENKFTQVRGQLEGYYDYTAHFVSLRQLLISRFWGYGPSVWIDAEDGMSFQIGHIHWILSLIIGGWLIFLIIQSRKKLIKSFRESNFLLPSFYLFVVGWFSAFMTHLRAIGIYKAIPILSLIQFPWRFLTIVIFAFSFISGVAVIIFENKKVSSWITGLLVAGLVIFNWNYFLPRDGKMGKLTDEEKFSGAAWDLQQTAGIYDYLPIYAEMAPNAPRDKIAEIIQGEGEIYNSQDGTSWAEFDIGVRSDIAQVRIGIFKFPGWKMFIDGKEVENFVAGDEKWGRMYVEVPKGEHKIRAEFTNTPVRAASNFISLSSWLGLFTFLVLKRKK